MPAMNEKNGYTTEEMKDYAKFMNHVNNDTIIDQTYRLNENILEVMSMEFPDNIPVLKIIASQTTKQVGQEYQINHLKRLGSNSESIALSCNHFIYHTNIADISDAAHNFLDNAKVKWLAGPYIEMQRILDYVD